MNNLKKELDFYLYVTPDFFDRKTNLVHIECLRAYAHIFDQAVFYLSLDDINNLELIKKVEQELLSLPFNGNVSFVIHKNDDLRESGVFANELVQKMKTEDKLIFFAHGKGYTNLDMYEERSMLEWLVGCYYLSLNFMEEVNFCINSNNRTFTAYGSFPLIDKKEYTPSVLAEPDANYYLGRIKYHWCYSGTFFWVNTVRLREYMRMFDVGYPEIFDRYYSEKFLGNILPQNCNITGHNNFLLYAGNNMYNNGVAEMCLWTILKEGDEFEKYSKFYDKVTNV